MDNDLLRLKQAVTGSINGLDSGQTQAAPVARPEKWSIQQIVEHLLLTWRLSIPGIQARIEKGRPTRAQPTLSQRAEQFRIMRLHRFPSGRASPAAVSPSLPDSLRSGDELAARIHIALDDLERVTAEAAILFGSQRAVSHPLLGPLSIAQWRSFHLVHGLHHVKQIKSIRRDNRI